MNDEDDETNEMIPKLNNLMVEFYFESEDKTVREYLKLASSESVFGSVEPVAEVKAFVVNKKDNTEELVQEGTISLTDWLGRIIAVFRKTHIESIKGNDSNASKTIEGDQASNADKAMVTGALFKRQSDAGYIFKRDPIFSIDIND